MDQPEGALPQPQEPFDDAQFAAESAAAAVSILQRYKEQFPITVPDESEFSSTPAGLPQEMRELQSLATKDPLTKLDNRRSFAQEYDRYRSSLALPYQRRTSEGHSGSEAITEDMETLLIYIDLDGFKKVNDAEGHQAGDKVLVTVAEKLLENIRSNDVAARLGGDEFALILFRSQLDKAVKIVDKIRQEVEAYTPVSLSAGISQIDGTRDLDPMLKEADEAMYQAKHDGKGKTVFFDGLAERFDEQSE